jgi:hypothetical protein
MLQYPSIAGSAKAALGVPCIAFTKYDGSNLRWEWSPKKGWNKFGTRRQMFDESDPLYSQAIPLFMGGLGDEIVYRTKQITKNPERITAFTEFFGDSSFAGSHDQNEEKQLKLFDVFLFKKGFIQPKQFVEMFEELPECAEVVYTGQLNRKFVMDVQKGKYPVFEGVIAKGNDFMVKIKTDEYFRRLRHKFNDEWTKYGE